MYISENGFKEQFAMMLPSNCFICINVRPDTLFSGLEAMIFGIINPLKTCCEYNVIISVQNRILFSSLKLFK